ncbi:MAG: glycosyltransferase [Bryobacteraceae bacterium]|nr:glycosyltransferase [Bryobacteraceae bacterium]
MIPSWKKTRDARDAAENAPPWPVTESFAEEFLAICRELLPEGGSASEAGGAAELGLTLAKSGEFSFTPGDDARRAIANHDLVFGGPRIEHCGAAEQTELLRSLAASSRRWVLMFLPNPLFYWGRIAGPETEAASHEELSREPLAQAFAQAGLRFHGTCFAGEKWAEEIIFSLPGLPLEWKDCIVTAHRRPDFPAESKCAVIAALGSVSGAEIQVPARWTRPVSHGERAAKIARSAENLRASTIQSLMEFGAQTDRLLAGYRAERAWRVMVAIRRAYTLLVRRRAWREFLRHPLPDIHELREYDIHLPSVWNYLPGELQVPVPGANTAEADFGDGQDLASRKFDVLILPVFEFHARFQRPQQIAVSLARAGHRVWWASPAQRAAAMEQFEQVPMRHNLWEVRMSGKAADLYSGELAPADLEDYAGSLAAWARAVALRECVVIVQFPFWRRLGLKLRATLGSPLIYDIMDDWRNWPADPRIGEFSLNEERALAAEADVVTVTSREFARRHHDNSPVWIPNGTDFQFFHSAVRTRLLPAGAEPVIGYYGAIAPWFDLELMTEVGRLRPQYRFVLIGQLHGVDAAALAALPNVRLLGEKHYRELPAWLAAFDVALIPFRRNTLTTGVDPVKLYEYFSQGKPVVATPIEDVRRHERLLYLAGPADEFAAAIDRALAEDSADRRRARIAFARDNTWDRRAAQFVEAARAKFPLVSIVTVTYNSIAFLPAFVDSIRRNTTWPNFEVIVFDNASTDGSPAYLARISREDPRFRVRLSSVNYGFAAGNNRAVREANGEYLIIQNPDTMVTAGWVQRLLGPLLRDPSIRMSAPVTNFSGNETRINFHYRDVREMEAFADEIARLRFHETRPLQVAPLLSAMLPRLVWEEMGGLDEQFEVGMFEDDDFSLRLRGRGHGIVTAEDCFIHHFGSGSFQQIGSAEAARIFEINKAKFEAKWGTRWIAHSPRPGVRPVRQEHIFTVREFVEGDRRRPRSHHPVPVLRALSPAAVKRGQPFQRQPGGGNAIAVECEHGAPGVAVEFDGRILETAFGNTRFLTAVLPPEWTEEAGTYAVRLLSDAGYSNTIEFVVHP